jgi:very-short-patch-repair endonuclease
VLGEILAERNPDVACTEGLFETLLERALRAAELPMPVRQHQVWENGKLVARVDFAYPEQRLALEPDGFRWHWGKRKWKRDLRRSNNLMLLGWRSLHITWEDLDERPNEVVGAVRRALSEELNGSPAPAPRSAGPAPGR